MVIEKIMISDTKFWFESFRYQRLLSQYDLAESHVTQVRQQCNSSELTLTRRYRALEIITMSCNCKQYTNVAIE